MALHVGDRVVHPAHGVGDIVKMEKRRFARKKAKLYYEVNTEKCTVWVPVEDHEDLGLRPLTEVDDLKEYRDLLTSPPETLAENHRTRRKEIKERLRNGTLGDICTVVRDLNARSWEGSLNDADDRLLRRAYESLIQEWVAATGKHEHKVVQTIEALLDESRERYEPEEEAA